MKRLVLTLVLVLVFAIPSLAFAASGPIHFNEPTYIPRNLDQLYWAIETGAPGWSGFTPCDQKGLSGSYFQWSMVKQILAYSQDDHGQSLLLIRAADLARIVEPGGISFPTQGTLKVTENALFSSLVQQVVAGKVLVCQKGGDLVLFGPGAQFLFDALALNVK
ncbi:MAG TPA: hypothetical protein VMT46_07435 [Anaerolineaceae bacterium]|nr:hypothetical protein [Anaerolineaceae bacterium]